MARPRDAQEFEAVFKEAAGRAAEGRLTLVCVPVDDQDVPPGIRRIFGEPGSASSSTGLNEVKQ